MLTLKRIFALSFVLMTLNHAAAMKEISHALKRWQDIKLELKKNEQAHQLHLVALSGDIEKLENFFEKNKEKIKNKEINQAVSEWFVGPLLCAVASGNLDCVKFLISHGADLHAKSKDEGTLLHDAVECGHIHIIEFLLNEEIDINAVTNEGLNVMHCAALYGFVGAAEILYKKNKELINFVNPKDGWTPLYCAVFANQVEFVQWLFNIGGNSNIGDYVDHNGNGVMHIAAFNTSFESAKIIFHNDQKIINSINPKNNSTPLHNIVVECNDDVLLKKQVEFVQWFIDMGIDLMALTGKKLNILHIAAHYNHKAVIECIFNWVRNIQNKPKMGDFMECLNCLDNKDKITKSCKTLLLIRKAKMKAVPKNIFLLITKLLFNPEDVIENMLTMKDSEGLKPMDFAKDPECKKLLTPSNNNDQQKK